jgi:hypothetical protein
MPEETSSKKDEYVDFIEEIYKLRYSNIKIIEPPVNIDLNLPNIDDMSPAQAYEIKKYLDEYLEQLTTKIGDYIEPTKQSNMRKNSIDNTLSWFNEAFELDNEDKEFDNLDVEIRKWFLVNCKIENFDTTLGYYIGKRSIYVDVVTTKYLQNKNLYICSIDGNGFIRKKLKYPEVDDIKSNYIQDYLKPLTKEDIKIFYLSKNFNNLEDEITKFLHCKCNEMIGISTHDNENIHFNELDY